MPPLAPVLSDTDLRALRTLCSTSGSLTCAELAERMGVEPRRRARCAVCKQLAAAIRARKEGGNG